MTSRSYPVCHFQGADPQSLCLGQGWFLLWPTTENAWEAGLEMANCPLAGSFLALESAGLKFLLIFRLDIGLRLGLRFLAGSTSGALAEGDVNGDLVANRRGWLFGLFSLCALFSFLALLGFLALIAALVQIFFWGFFFGFIWDFFLGFIWDFWGFLWDFNWLVRATGLLLFFKLWVCFLCKRFGDCGCLLDRLL